MITTTQALTKIFAKNKKNRDSRKNTSAADKNVFKQWRLRFKVGTLGIEAQEKILLKFGYVKKKDSGWVRNVNK